MNTTTVMKLKTLLFPLLWTLLSVATHQTTAQTTAIPDSNFEQALIDLGIDSNGLNGNILNADAEAVTGAIDVGGKNITDLTGIEAFTSITRLILWNNQVSSLDVSSNTALTTLSCGMNQLTSLDLSNNPNLKFLYCQINQLSTLDLSANPLLQILQCQGNSLTSLDLSSNPDLTSLGCDNNQLTSLDLSGNLALTGLNCGGNDLTNLDLSVNTVLKSLSVTGNYNLLTLNVKNGNNINFTNFSAINNYALKCIEVDDAAWSTANWTNITPGNYFSENCNAYVPDDNFEQALIDLGYDTAPLDDYVPKANINSVTSIDVSNQNITDLTGIEEFLVLEVLYCQNNQLTDLDLSQNTSLTQLNASGNSLTSMNIKNGNNNNMTSFDATSNPNLICIEVDDAVWSGANWTNIDASTSFSADCSLLGVMTSIPDDNFEQALINLGLDDVLDDQVATANINTLTSLSVMNENIADLTGIEDFDSLTSLICFGNALTSLNVSNNTKLKTLFCHSNQLTTLDVTNNTELTDLRCGNNNLTNIDVSQNTLLYKLSIDGNDITLLDVSNNTGLTSLSCQSNALRYLDVSQNNLLQTLYCHNNQLVQLNVKNGNNNDINLFNATNNPDLACIEVDDPTYSTTNWTDIDAHTSFSDVCQYDDDGDGVINDQEVTDGTDPQDGCKYLVEHQVIEDVSNSWNQLDCDCDGITNADEIIAGDTPLPSPPTGSIEQNFCMINSPTIDDLIVSGENIKWYATSTTETPLNAGSILEDATSYFASQTVGECEESDRLEVAVTLVTTPVPTASTSQDFCIHDNPVLTALSASGDNIQWYSASTGGTPLASDTPLENGSYYVSQTANSCESERLEIQVTLSIPDPPAASATQSFCEADNPTVTNLVANGTNIQWYAESSGGTPLDNGTTLSAGNYYASQTINNCESDRIAVTVNFEPPTAPAASSQQTFCVLDDPTVGDLSASGSNVSWYNAATGTSPLPESSVLSNGTYFVSQANGSCESDRTEVSVIVLNTPAPTGSMEQSFCSGMNPTIQDLEVTGDNIQWYDTSIGGTPLSQSTTLMSGSYYATQTIDDCESTRLEVTVILEQHQAPGGSTTQTFCASDLPTVAELIANGTDIKWYIESTGGDVLAATTLLENGNYFASQTIDNCESERLEVSVLLEKPDAPTATSTQTFCTSGNPTVAQLEVTGSNVQWYREITGGTALASNIILENGTYFASQTVDNCESDRIEITVVLEQPEAPAAATTQTFCISSNPTVAQLEASGSNIQWYQEITGGTVLASNTILENGTYFASQTVDNCESERIEVAVVLEQPEAPSAITTQTFCASSNPTVAQLEASGSNILWYREITGGTALASSTILENGNYFASQTIDNCESDRIEVAVVLEQPEAPTAALTQSFCASDNPTVNDLAATGTNIQWYTEAAGGSALASNEMLDNRSYYVSQTIDNCESNRLEVEVLITTPLAPTAPAVQFYCLNNNPTIADLEASGDDMQWYEQFDGTIPLPDTTSLAAYANSFLYGSQIVSGCESDRTEILIELDQAADAPIVSPQQSFCFSDSATIADIDVDGSNIIWYLAMEGGSAVSDTTSLTNNTSYFASQTTNDCGESPRAEVHITIHDPLTPTVPDIQRFCQEDAPTLADLLPSGDNHRWYDAPTAGNELTPATLVSTQSYFVAAHEATCESPRVEVRVELEACEITGSNAHEDISMLIYPVPTTGNLTVEMDKVYGEVKVRIYDILGRSEELKGFNSTNKFNLSIPGISGVYIIEISTNDGPIQTFRVIKK